MGNGFSTKLFCFSRPPRGGAPNCCIVEPWPPDDEAPGHSFRYLPRSPTRGSPPHASAALSSDDPYHEDGQPPRLLAFRAISGAAVSANSSSRPVFRRRPADRDGSPTSASPAASNPAGFEGSSSFAAAPLQLSSSAAATGDSSGPLDRGIFSLSGPIESGAVSGPLDGGGAFSGPLMSKKRRNERSRRRRAFYGSDSLVFTMAPPFFRRRSLLESRNCLPSVVPLWGRLQPRAQWAHGKAGEDRVHIVVSEEHRWLFIGIYDGFNGPDAPEFLAAHLYRAVFEQLRGLFWEEQEYQKEQEGAIALVEEGEGLEGDRGAPFMEGPRLRRPLREFLVDEAEGDPSTALRSVSDRFGFPKSKLRDGSGSWRKESRKFHFSHWSYGGEGDEKSTGKAISQGKRKRWRMGSIDHELVLEALSRALESTEVAYLEMTDRELGRNPELALMGSCLLVVLMRENDVYVMNVGDSRVIVAQRKDAPFEAQLIDNREHYGDGTGLSDIAEVSCPGMEEAGNQVVRDSSMELVALQLSTDHNTGIYEEVKRIKEEHPDDSKCIVNNRVKGRLKVTRAFGAGFLKQPKWNNGLLEMFRNDYIGFAPYISCSPSLSHHKLGPQDQFLVISSDGLYQYLTNEEVVSHVHNFMERVPDGDPAQSLIEELLFRAAIKAGMESFELLDIPQGDRRKYHDDVTVVVISLDGQTWKSSSK